MLPLTMDGSLYRACCEGNKEVVQMLASFKIVKYVDPTLGDTPLHQACRQGWLDIVKLFIEQHGCDPNVTSKYHHESPLHYACKYGHKKVVEYLINEQDVNPRDGRDPTLATRDTLLHQVCKQGWLDIVKLFIEIYGCDPNVTSKYHESPLHYACQYGHKKVVEYLINEQDVNPRDGRDPTLGDTLLHQVCEQGWLDIVKLLIEKYACDPNVINWTNQNLLHYACRYGHIDVVEYLVKKHHLNPLLRDRIGLEPLDYALNNNKTDIAIYICQHCITSVDLLNPNRIKTTINLIISILRANNPFDQKWKTTDGDNILHIVESSKSCISCMPSAVVLEILNSGAANYNIIPFQPDWKTGDGDKFLELVCQSKTYLSHISSALILRSIEHVTIDLVKISIPDSKTADGKILIQFVCQSEVYLAHISTAVLSKWLSDTTLDLEMIINTPEWKTADGSTLLQLICQSKTCLSRVPSTLLLKWLSNTALYLPNIVTVPILETADGDTLLKLVCQSEMCLSRIPSAVLLMWLIINNVPFDDEFKQLILSDRKTANGDTVLQLVCQSEACLSRISSMVILKWLTVTILDTRTPTLDSKTADDKSLLLQVCRSETCVSLISSAVMSKWLSDTTLNLINTIGIIVPHWKTADGDTLLKLICQSEKCLSLVPSVLLLKWVSTNTTHDLTKTCLHNSKTADSDTLLQLVCQSKSWLSQTTSTQLIKWLSGSTLDHVKISIPDSKTADGKPLLQLVCQLETTVSHIFSAVLSKWLRDTSLGIKLENIIIPEWKTANGDTLLQLVCQSEICLLQISSAVFSKWLCDTTLDFMKIVTPDWKTADGNTLLQLILQSEMSISKTSTTVLSKWLSDSSEITIDLLKMVNANWITLDGDYFFHALCQSKIEENKLLEVIQHYLQEDGLNPDIMDSNENTVLHLACQTDNPTMVNLLLSVTHCDPNIKNKNKEVPLQMTTNPEIIKDLIRHGAKTNMMYESYQKALGASKPIEPPVKVFVVGNPSVGKSTLTAALTKKIGFVAWFFSLGKVSGVDEKTVGIVPHDLESDIFGRVTLYDFAGHREFYSGHAALLQSAIQSTPPIFLLVVNLCEEDDEVIKNILYWITFLENQCASVSCKPHVILIGSHADTLIEVNPKDKVETIIDSLDTKRFTNMEFIGFIAMNCRYYESAGMNDLRRLLIKSCDELRIHEPITFNAHCFLVFLIDTFMNLPAVTIKSISEKIINHRTKKGVLEFLPQNFEAIYKICLELNNRGHILLLKDRIAVENSYIVIDKEFLLSKISGTVFAPEGFKQYKQLSTHTGVVPLSNIAKCFPNKELDILIGFLTHLEFCHEISDQALQKLISKQYSQVSDSKERYYLFPGLISVKADDTVWNLKPQSEYDYTFGWILKCTHLEQFFSSRFLQVLLLRLAFTFALETSCDDPNQNIGIHRKCYLWKNGIFWGSVFGMQILVEVTPDNKSVILLARFRNVNLLQCIKHRSEVIGTILQCKEWFCPRVLMTEQFVHSFSPLQYPLNLEASELNICTLKDLATAVVSDCVQPSVVVQCDPIPAEHFLSFEPYLEMKLSTIQDLWDKNNEKKVISENFLLKFSRQATEKLISLVEAFTEHSESDIRADHDQLYQCLLRWRDNDETKQKTYKDLREKIDQYSVFAGRNVLVSISIV